MTRAQHLFYLGSLCAVPALGVNDLTVTDFAYLVSGIRAHNARNHPAQ